MFKLWATIRKDLRILLRDKVGLAFMFLMPVFLAVLITAIQNSTFNLVNDHKIVMLVKNNDSGELGKELVDQISKTGIFLLIENKSPDGTVENEMRAADALAGILIPVDFSAQVKIKTERLATRILGDLGMNDRKADLPESNLSGINIFFNPVLQESFHHTIRGSLKGALQLTENKQLIRNLYASMDQKFSNQALEKMMTGQETRFNETITTLNGSKKIPNATQHNIPAWTIFAMFFVVISLGSAIVKEKMNGSIYRLRTLPTSYQISLISKQLTFLAVTLLQALLIFFIGIFLFPLMNLPRLTLPDDMMALVAVTFLSGWCAVSFAICVGLLARTQEQANGFGAAAVVILAAIGGILVPAFAMPSSFALMMKLSPMHWCLESYYGLFLEQGKFKDIFMAVIPILIMILILQVIAYWASTRKRIN